MKASSLIDRMLRRHDGPLTRRLLRSPGRFGLGQVPHRLAPDATTRLVCGFCSTGCALDAHLRRGEAVNLSPNTDYPVNRGQACPKGWEALAPLDAADRATQPLLRSASGALEPVSWERALGEFTARFRAVAQQHGPEAIAFLSTGQIPTEEMFCLGVLAKFGMGMVDCDSNTRQCMATSAVAYKESFGFDAPPYTYRDFEESDVIVLVGSNLCISHPILWERICRNPHRPEILVVDPRATETALAATQHYAIRPKSDLRFFYAIAALLIERGWIDRDYVAAHTEGFEAFAQHVRDYSPESVAGEVGLPLEAFERFARAIHRGQRVSFWWTMGVNQGHESVRTAQALIDLALLTGSIGRPGTGANSITGQCNAMGSRLFSNTTGLFAGREFENGAHRAEVAEILGIDEARIPRRKSLAYDEILAAVRAGRIRALWVIGTNTAHSWIDQTELRETLARLDVLVVQDMYTTTETARCADLLLPAAGWGEKDGTFINSERRFGLTKRVRGAPGQALADFHIFRLVAEAWGCGELLARWNTPEDVFETLRALSRGRPCDFTGISGYAMLEQESGVQWPLPQVREAGFARLRSRWATSSPNECPRSEPKASEDQQEGAPLESPERRLFSDGRYFHPDGRARFRFEAPRAVPEPPDAAYPLVLLTGRGSSAQWHTQTRTAKSAVLRKLHRAELCAEIHPKDAHRFGIEPEGWVLVSSRRGSVLARALVRETVREGEIFLPMHDAATNRLTYPAFDPYSRQPSYKHCAVRIEAAPVQC